MLRSSCLLLALLCVASLLAHPGNGIVVLRDGSVITGDAVGNGIWVFREGRPPERLASSFHCHWLTQGLNGQLLAETSGERSGEWSTSIHHLSAVGSNPSHIWTSSNLSHSIFTADDKGRLVVLERGQLMAREKDGRLLPFRGDGKAPQSQPPIKDVHAFAWGPKQVLYLCDGPRIRKVGPDGKVVLVRTLTSKGSHTVYSGRGGSFKVWGLAVDGAGRPIVTDPGNGRVIRMESDGSLKTVATAIDGWRSIGVAASGQNIYLLEGKLAGNQNLGPRVRVVDATGRSRILGTVTHR